jgi:CRISPR-associated endonuclease/helicase Cas3
VWAHSVNDLGERHELADHARATAALSRRFGASFGAAELCEALGLLHDAGKAAAAWQQRLMAVEGTSQPVGLPHKQLSTFLLGRRAGPAAMCVLGHHGGLGDREAWHNVATRDLDAGAAEARAAFLDAVPEAARLLAEPEALLPALWRPARNRDALEMGLRLSFSALVDADHLDTAAHFRGRRAGEVREPADLAGLLVGFERARAEALAVRPASPVDGVRAEVYQAAVAAAAGPVGIYRLPAPTGAGKTMAAAAFGLHHAVRHGKSRVIIAVPFITVTEQNARVYRDLLGEDAVLEHHSAVDSDQRYARLGAENWDAPFVVTTTVQLFDSLFGRKPARSRKVHRLANAVVVLDEVQALPADLLLPILDGLRVLAEYFGTTVLLASATQPAFQRLSVWQPLQQRIREVIPDPTGLYERLRRVRYEWRLGPPLPELSEVADEVAGHDQALVVVSTVTAARRMFRLLRERKSGAVRHLSTRMCPAHRQAVLAEVHGLLAGGEQVTLVSTQLIEAGVDVDFPAVFRAIAPADSLQQAAGRANREGRRPDPGLVVVFDAADVPVPPFYRTAVGQTRLHFGSGKADPDDRGALDRYYTGLYNALNLDRAERGTTIQANRTGRDSYLNFESVAEGPLRDAGDPQRWRDRSLAFRMLDDDAVPVAVASYGEPGLVDRLLDDLRAADGARRDTFRALQPYVVSLPRHVADRRDVRALLRPVVGDLCQWVGDYDDAVGIDDGDTVTASVW